MTWFVKDEGSTKPDESNIINLDEILEQFKKEITNHVDNEIERFKQKVNEIK